ncbi:peptidase, families S8 and S53 [Lysobacter enzymogenes]|uniref:Peptidase, families S8 and S53 n=1 Tax=Lysobacter enzymogenes TaxID=69 RepID=A0A0S2DE01_LYSEN|nr:S8 family peptidase [Lysobacter enzymogenes]ALN56775.1 peptidase, families S8 and S53 [Lysobacter enzymogenes]QCW25529.1 peptidase S8 [Lysobacter enzymogenes]
MGNRHPRSNALSLATALVLGACAFAPAYAGGKANLASLEDGSRSFGRFVVTYRSGTAPRRDAAALERSLGNAASALGLNTLQRLRRTATGSDVVVSPRPLSRAEATALLHTIAADPNVESVENDMRMVPYWTPNDSRFREQFGFGSGAGGIRATTAWDVARGAGTVVAVIDTGIASHSDLNGNLVGGYDFISALSGAEAQQFGAFFIAADGNARDANPADPGDWNDNPNACRTGNSSWHGTHVAGTVAAVTNNAKGVAGTAPAAKVVPVRVLGRCGGFSSDIADAITWASGGAVPGVPANPNPADVINMSLGGSAPGACPQSYKNAIVGAAQRGSIVVVAAGNDDANASTAVNSDGQPVGYTMTNCGTVISVGATTSSGGRSSFSNFGPGVDIAAPGSGILSTVNNGLRGPTTEAYKAYDGTSMATPHVAGVAALVQSVARTPLTQEQMRTLLKNTARPFPVSPGAKPIGAGIVNADAAVKAAKAL